MTPCAFANDLSTIADTLGIDKMVVVGLSGGGPYTLGCAAAMPDRVVAAGVIGGVAPTKGRTPYGWRDGRPRYPRGAAAAGGRNPDRAGRQCHHQVDPPGRLAAADLYGRVSPEGDRRLLARPEIKAMFFDDLLNGSRKQLAAPFSDVVVFARDWGFRLDEVKVPVRWWTVAPTTSCRSPTDSMLSGLPDAEIYPMPGESHLGGLGRAEEILHTMIDMWDASGYEPAGRLRADQLDQRFSQPVTVAKSLV